MLDVRFNTVDLQQAIEDGPPTALFPIGSIEQHGPHLPVGTDWMIGNEISRRVAEELNAFLLPTLPFGTAQEHSPTAGTVWFRQQTLFTIVKDVLSALAGQGFRQAVVLTTHGGNWIIKPAVREFNLDHPDFQAILVAPHEAAGPRLRECLEQEARGIHAEEMETSLMLHHDRASVRMERAVDFYPQVGREFLDYVGAVQVLPNGVWGEATLATAEKGKQALNILVEATVAYISRTFDHLSGRLSQESAAGDPS